MRFDCISAALSIYALSDRLQMGRIAARGIAAKVVDVQAGWDGAYESFVGGTVSQNGSVCHDPAKPSISSPVTATLPNPASRFLVDDDVRSYFLSHVDQENLSQAAA